MPLKIAATSSHLNICVSTYGFYTQYAHARDIGLDCLADRALEITETPLVAEKRVQKADGSVEITTADAVDRSRLTVDSLKWYLCKLAPKKYGDKIDATLSGPDGGPVQNTVNFRFFDDKPPEPEK